jgi:hypothetical protein
MSHPGSPAALHWRVAVNHSLMYSILAYGTEISRTHESPPDGLDTMPGAIVGWMTTGRRSLAALSPALAGSAT